MRDCSKRKTLVPQLNPACYVLNLKDQIAEDEARTLRTTLAHWILSSFPLRGPRQTSGNE